MKNRILVPEKAKNGLSAVLLRIVEGYNYPYEGFLGGGTGVAYAIIRLFDNVPNVLAYELFD